MNKNKGFFNKLRGWFAPAFFIFGLACVINVTKVRPQNFIFLTVAGMMVTFISIFYPLIIKSDVKVKIETFVSNNIASFTESIKRDLDEIKSNLTNAEIVSKKGQEIQKKAGDLTDFNERADLDKNSYKCILALLISVVLLLNDIALAPSPLTFQNTSYYFLAWPGYIFFWYGFYKVIMIIYSWKDITSKR